MSRGRKSHYHQGRVVNEWVIIWKWFGISYSFLLVSFSLPFLGVFSIGFLLFLSLDLPSYVAKFRTAYDPTIPTWYSGILHFSLLNIMVGFVMLHSFYTIFGANYHAVGIYHLTTMLLLTFVFANYLEYLAHRYVLHDPHDKNHRKSNVDNAVNSSWQSMSCQLTHLNCWAFFFVFPLCPLLVLSCRFLF